MAELFYSDPHYGHAPVIEHAGRPFASVEEMDRELVARYQAAVGSSDTVYWLGDCFFLNLEKAAAVMAQLPGRKVLVRGNHDRGPGPMAKLGFDLVVEHAVMQIAGHPVELCHYPYRRGVREGDRREFSYPEPKQGWALVHGHTHSKKRRNGTQIHVGVDAWDFQPVPMDDVEWLVRQAFNEESP